MWPETGYTHIVKKKKKINKKKKQFPKFVILNNNPIPKGVKNIMAALE